MQNCSTSPQPQVSYIIPALGDRHSVHAPQVATISQGNTFRSGWRRRLAYVGGIVCSGFVVSQCPCTLYTVLCGSDLLAIVRQIALVRMPSRRPVVVCPAQSWRISHPMYLSFPLSLFHSYINTIHQCGHAQRPECPGRRGSLRLPVDQQV
jgi:hypothetical protein